MWHCYTTWLGAVYSAQQARQHINPLQGHRRPDLAEAWQQPPAVASRILPAVHGLPEPLEAPTPLAPQSVSSDLCTRIHNINTSCWKTLWADPQSVQSATQYLKQ